MRFLTAALLGAGLCVASANALVAQERGFGPEAARYTEVSLTAELSGVTVKFADGSSARYGADGSFAFVHRPGTDPFTGSYRIGENGRVCIDYHAGLTRCDTYVREADQMVLVHDSGHRFPVLAVTRN
jgi:hypothetical protein